MIATVIPDRLLHYAVTLNIWGKFGSINVHI